MGAAGASGERGGCTGWGSAQAAPCGAAPCAIAAPTHYWACRGRVQDEGLQVGQDGRRAVAAALHGLAPALVALVLGHCRLLAVLGNAASWLPPPRVARPWGRCAAPAVPQAVWAGDWGGRQLDCAAGGKVAARGTLAGMGRAGLSLAEGAACFTTATAAQATEIWLARGCRGLSSAPPRIGQLCMGRKAYVAPLCPIAR